MSIVVQRVSIYDLRQLYVRVNVYVWAHTRERWIKKRGEK